jgi:uncharacterized membrane protein YphA (DoxX/SURF4 family)
MSVVLWIVQVLLGLAFLGAGILKVTKSRQELEPAMPWVEDVGDGTLRLIGVLEMLAATGLLVPPVTGIAPILSPVAAVGLAVLMVLATLTHVRRHEIAPNGVVTVALLAMAAFVAWGRFGPHAL